MPIENDPARHDPREGNDDHKQPGDLYRQMTAAQKARLIRSIPGSKKRAPELSIRLRVAETAGLSANAHCGLKPAAG